MVIFNSYVSLPEGKPCTEQMGNARNMRLTKKPDPIAAVNEHRCGKTMGLNG